MTENKEEVLKNDQEISNTTDTKPKKNENSFWELLKFAFIALIIVIPIRTFIAQPFIVSGSSMVPTFEDKQYLIVDELSYRFENPNRGDVIIFHPPQNESVYYIKRIIGLPNETVEISGGTITIKNSEHPDGFVLDEPYIVKPSNDTASTHLLGPKEYFVMGDNRTASSDSRAWGNLPADHITGRAFLRLLPITDISIFPGEYHTYSVTN